MKIYLIIILFFICGFYSCKSTDVQDSNLTQYVDPFVGTAYTGHTTPAAACPLGFVQPGPQTGNFGWEHCSGYNYNDSLIWGFTQNKLNGTGIPDMGDLLMMPFSGVSGKEFKSKYSKDREIASPGYYSVYLDDNHVKVELSCTPHVAIHKYSFDQDGGAVYINFQSGSVSTEEQYETRVINSKVNVADDYTISGFHHLKGWVERQLYYIIQFDKPIVSIDTIKGNERNKAPVCVFHFNQKKGDVLQAKVALSTVSIEGAYRNMDSELAHWNFNQVKEGSSKRWEDILSRVEIEGSVEQKRNFYTSMYHLFFQPNNMADVDGKYRGANDSVLVSLSGEYYSTFSLWDTFRAAHPMYTILVPEKVPDMINTMLTHSKVQGFLPIWALWGKENYCMIGNHGIPVVVEACMKDIEGVDPAQVYGEVKNTLTRNHYRSEWNIYDEYGYYPFDLIKDEAVSRTLEGAYDDYCAAQLARKLGKEEDYRFFMKRANYYKNLFDPESRLMRGKDTKGSWREPFDKFALSHAGTAGGDYTEGNAWQYTWHVLHDIDGLIDLMGGKEAFTTKLDSLFFLQSDVKSTGFVGDVTGLIGQYAHGNEPSHHVVYMYTLAGEQWRTAELVREIFDKFYLPKPDGLCGNDDCGQMSAWYMFSALGFYPVDPVSGNYVLGAPQIPQATIHLLNGKYFTVKAQNYSSTNKYVKSVMLNGNLITNTISHAQIMDGGTLVFEMTDTPLKHN